MKGRAVFYQQNLLNFYKYAISENLGRKDLRMNDRKFITISALFLDLLECED